jgi:ABC-type Mn2+/Zn2+ transport system permease subunit
VALAYLFNGNLLLGALIAAVVVALLIGFLSRQGTIKEDTAIGILFAAALSLGVLLISSIRTYAVDLTHIMFGNVLGVSTGDLIVTAVLAVVVLGFIVVFFREFLVMSFDPVLAATLRMRAERFRMLMLILLALTIVVSLQTVGVGLVAALLVTPGAAAYLLTRRLSSMMIAAGFLGALSSVVGLYLSFYLSVASGAAVVLTATLIFLLAYLFAPARGLLPRRWQARGARIHAA